MQLNLSDILTVLSVIAVGMVIILLYHLIFVSVSLRRIADRMDDLTKEVEAIILKPIGAIEYLIDWFASAVEGMREKQERKKGHHKK
jgi:hypothetical protein